LSLPQGRVVKLVDGHSHDIYIFEKVDGQIEMDKK
jgi:hypothetical protein